MYLNEATTIHFQGKNWRKAEVRPEIGHSVLLIEDGKHIVEVVAHSKCDDEAFFYDSPNWKGVNKVGDAFITTYIDRS